MMGQNKAEKDAKPLTTCRDGAVAKPAQPSEIRWELTDDELVAVTGGLNPQPLPPSPPPGERRM